jgi:hypothetical protein
MRLAVATLAFLAAALPRLLGQGVSVEVALDQEQFLPGETLVVRVRISNFTGQPLELGKDDTWLSFSVENSHRIAVGKRGTVPVKGAFTLEPSTTGTKKVDIAPYFDILPTGRYYVSAIILLPEWRQALQTKAMPFDIIKGSSIWEQEFGVPSTGKEPGSLPEIRRYSLIQTLHSRVIQLYLSLTDSRGGQVFRVYPLGQMVSFSNPEPQLDKFSNLHVLYQSSGRLFMHCLVNPDGVLLARETYEVSGSRPVLRAETDGRITVAGGTRRIGPNDLPPPASPSTSGPDVTPPQP